MFETGALAAILEGFGGAPVSVHSEYCLNARHKDAGCRRCADACPTQAIALKRGQLHLDAEGCVNCGLCLHQCPTDVFTQQGAHEPNLSQTVSMLPEDAVVLVCPQKDDVGMTRAPAAVVVRHKRCLGSLSVWRLLELTDAGQRAIWLDDSPCAACPIGHVQPCMAQTVATANHLLQAFGHPAAIHTYLSHSDTLHDEPVRRRVIDGDQPEVSRRGFFSALGQLTRRTAVSIISESIPTPEPGGLVPVDQRLPHRIPPSRGELFRQLKRLGTPAADPIEASGVPFAEVVVDGETCSACGLCARFCPTGALSFAKDAEGFALSFKPVLCLDCGICPVACPEGSVSFGSHLAAGALIDTESHTLVAGPLAPCAGCGVPTAVRHADVGAPDGEPRCYVCRKSTGSMAPLRDSAGLLADLMGRWSDPDTSDE